MKHTKRVQRKQNEGIVQQFLQQNENGRFKLVLIEKPKGKTTPTKSSLEKNKLPPVGFKPVSTSTPKRKSNSSKAVSPCLAISEFIDELPKSSKEPDEETIASQPCIKSKPAAVYLRNFLGEPPKAFQTIYIEDFTDSPPVTPATVRSQLNEEVQNKVNIKISDGTLRSQLQPKERSKPADISISNLDSTKDVLRSIFCKDYSLASRQQLKESVPRDCGTNDTFQNFENILQRRSQVVETTFAGVDDSMQLVFKDLSERTFEREDTLLSPAEFKVPSVRISRNPAGRPNETILKNISYLFKSPQQKQQHQMAKDPVLRNSKFEQELEKLLQIDEHGKKSNNFEMKNHLDDALKRQTILDNDSVEFWTSNEDLSLFV